MPIKEALKELLKKRGAFFWVGLYVLAGIYRLGYIGADILAEKLGTQEID